MLTVVEPGLFSSIQDGGRPDQGHLGVARAGSADDLARIVANLLVGNEPAAPVLEMTLLGGTFEVHDDVMVAICGADMEARIPEEDRALSVARGHRLSGGTTLIFGGALDGARTYLALQGGIEADHVLGSASTDPIARFGGIEGRVLRAGDVLRRATDDARFRWGLSWPTGPRSWPAEAPASGVATAAGARTVSIVPGPHHAVMPDSVLAALSETTWTVTPRSDRVGLRLSGVAIADLGGLDLVSLPMLPGAVQIPPAGLPILLMPDAPSVGGYPVPAVVAEVDGCILGQLRPGDELRFVWTDAETARRRAADRAEQLVAIAAVLP